MNKHILKTCFVVTGVIIAVCNAGSQVANYKSTTNLFENLFQYNASNTMSIYCPLIIGKTSDSLLRCNIGIYGRTNVTIYRPLLNQVYDAHLYSEEGREVSKTSYGLVFGMPLKPDSKLLDGSWQNDVPTMYGHSRILSFESGYGSTREWSFDILKSFRIKEPGHYRLTVQVRLFTKDTNGIFQPFVLPPVETKVYISESDLGQ